MQRITASGQAPESVAWDAIGTRVTVFATEPESLPDACAVVRKQVEELDVACSRFRQDSELARLNRAAGRWVTVSPLFLELLGVSLQAAQASEGIIDPTIGKALRLAGYDRDFADLGMGLPRRVVVVATPGWRSIEIDPDRSAVRVPQGVELDLGASAKAFAADRAARDASVVTGIGVLVNLGGDLAVEGPPPSKGWSIRVTDDHAAPFDAPGQTVSIVSGGLATSSTTVRHWTAADGPMHHIFDPSTGRPANGTWRTASVAAASCLDANIASTAAIVLGSGAGAWLDSLGLAARLVSDDGDVLHIGDWPRAES